MLREDYRVSGTEFLKALGMDPPRVHPVPNKRAPTGYMGETGVQCVYFKVFLKDSLRELMCLWY